jgi:signal transduction histidine kinase
MVIIPCNWQYIMVSWIFGVIYNAVKIYEKRNHIPNTYWITIFPAMFYFVAHSYLLSGKLKELYNYLRKNELLGSEMRKVIEVFPSGVMIHSKHYDSIDDNINFTNIEFKNQIKKINSRISELDTIDVTFEQSVGNTSSTVSCDLHTYLKNIHSKLKDNEIFEQNKINIRVKPDEVSSTEESKDESSDDEKHFIFTIKIMKVEWDGRKCFMNVFSDNTAILKLERATNNIRMQKVMFTSVSHEFRTPLNAIINSFGFIKSSFESLPEEIKSIIGQQEKQITKFIKIGATSSTLLLSLIEDILNLSKIEAGVFTINKESFNVAELMDEIYDIFYFQCQQKRIKLEMNIDNAFNKINIVSDRGRIKQILLNLMSNSYKFTFRGSITMTVRVQRTFNDRKIEF